MCIIGEDSLNIFCLASAWMEINVAAAGGGTPSPRRVLPFTRLLTHLQLLRPRATVNMHPVACFSRQQLTTFIVAAASAGMWFSAVTGLGCAVPQIFLDRKALDARWIRLLISSENPCHQDRSEPGCRPPELAVCLTECRASRPRCGRSALSARLTSLLAKP